MRVTYLRMSRRHRCRPDRYATGVRNASLSAITRRITRHGPLKSVFVKVCQHTVLYCCVHLPIVALPSSNCTTSYRTLVTCVAPDGQYAVVSFPVHILLEDLVLVDSVLINITSYVHIPSHLPNSQSP